MRKILIQLTAIFLVMQATAQRKQGSWQEYLSFSSATKVAPADQKIYCVTGGGLFYFDQSDNSVNKVSGVNGLNDFGIQTIAWSPEHKVLVVAYQNSNIDFIYENRIVNLPDIKRKQLTGDKTIYNISFSGDVAYLSCGFGIVAVNLLQNEVRDTYFIGQDGNAIQVNDVEIFNSYIYAATEKGLLKAPVSSNLLDFRNWEPEENIPHANENFNFLEVHAGTLIANYNAVNFNEIYRLNENTWQNYPVQVANMNDVRVDNNVMIVSTGSAVYFVDAGHNIVNVIDNYTLNGREITAINPKSAGISSDGSVWIADSKNGLVHVAGNNVESIVPNGPLNNSIFSLLNNQEDLWITAGGRSDSWGNIGHAPEFQLYRGGEWNYFTREQYPELLAFNDMVTVAVDPTDPNHVFAASWGGGVLEFQGNVLLNRFTFHNSTLESALQPPSEYYIRIGGLDFDSEGNLWVSNSYVANNLHRLSRDGEWKSFTLPAVANNYNIGNLIVTENDDKWIIVPRGNDAYVVDKTGAQKKRLLVTSYFSNGEQEIINRMNDVFCMVEDLDGAIWVGTSKGVAVYNNPRQIWESGSLYAIQPSLDLNDGLYHPLLETETITAIAVDGANRKWIGTRNSGIYLVSENGEKEVLHFTSSNSPLYSNNITALSINQISGEVFIGTSEGLISYQGDAIGAKNAFANVYVYPNPVRETWDGMVTITGLMEDTNVKITDITGNLVFQGTSLGGQAVWNGKNLNGNRVKTGVYLVFCTDNLGENTHIEKLLFIN